MLRTIMLIDRTSIYLFHRCSQAVKNKFQYKGDLDLFIISLTMFFDTINSPSNLNIKQIPMPVHL